MASYNKVVLVGNITRDIELRYTSGGTAVTDIGLAVNERRKDGQGNWQEETVFVDVTLWGRTAEVAGEYLSKGSPVLIDGRLQLDRWTDQSGNNRQKLKVVCDKMQMLGSGGGGGNRSGGQGGGQQRSQQQPAGGTGAGGQQIPDDEIPF